MDLPIFCQIASYSLDSYISMLSIPDFARYVRINNYKFWETFKRIEKDNDTITYYFNNKKYMVKNLKHDTYKWYKDDELHHDNDLPAVVTKNGTAIWFINGCAHRDNDLPSVICNIKDKDNQLISSITSNVVPLVLRRFPQLRADIKVWCKRGNKHRDNDLPTIVISGLTEFWFQNNKIHRENDQPATIWYNGTKKWYKNGIEYNP